MSVRPDDNARSFADEIVKTGLAADVSRVSRWETGQAAAPLEVLKAYETSLALADGSLTSIAVALRRTSTRDEPTRAKFSPARLQHALDTVFDSEATGASWLDLATQVAAKPESVTLPGSVWRSLTVQLVRELPRSLDHAYLARAEAVNLLARHPVASPRLAEAITEYATRDSDEAVVAARVTALLQRYGARAAGSTAGLHDAVHALAEPDLARLLAFGAATERIEPEPAQPLSWARRVIEGRGDSEDPILDRLVSEALFHSSYSHRFYAAFTLALSPSRTGVAAGAAAQLESAPPFVAQRLADLLGFVCTEAERALVHRLVTHRSPDLSVAALHYAGLTADSALHAEAADPGLPESRRFLAQWWLAEGSALKN
ncbi:MAG TPA: hypothetical protein VLI04_15180 [Nocardioidaceae bacterium]|nr:hypothetical protein [Nocardioidaceae bacterium]